jgi:hypothetical protein
MAWRGNNPKPTINRPSNSVNSGPEMSGIKKELKTMFGTPEYDSMANRKRGYNLRRDTDTQKDFSVKLLDIDSVILEHVEKYLNPTIIDSGRQVKVPVNYASPERWKAIQKDGYIRDKNGKVQTPAIVFRRSTVQKNEQLASLNRYLLYPFVKSFSEKNKYDKFSLLTGFKKTKEVYSVVLPDHVIINYEFIVWTELVEQCNSIIEAINFSTEDYWGDETRFRFRTSITDYNFETAVEAGDDRVVKATFSLMCYAYLLPEKFENHKSTTQKAFTPRKIIFDTEMVGSLEDMEIALSKKPKEIIETKLGSGFAGLVQFANLSGEAASAFSAMSSLFAVSSSLVIEGIETGSLSLGALDLTGVTGSAASSSFETGEMLNISTFETIDSMPENPAHAVMWLVSIKDDTNFKSVEVAAGWDSESVNYYVTEVSQIGSVPVNMSVTNTGGTINLVANPLSGTWGIKYIRIVV